MRTVNVTSRKHDKNIERLDGEIACIEQQIEATKRSVEEMSNRPNASGNFGIDQRDEQRLSGLRAEILDLEGQADQFRYERRDLQRSISIYLDAVLQQVNGRAVMYALDAERVIAFAHELDALFAERGIHARNRIGAEVTYRPAGQSMRTPYATLKKPNITTCIVLRRVQDGWRLVSAERDHCYINQKEFKQMVIPRAANDNIIEKATIGFVVRDADEDEDA